jgi:hypothetical protein
MEYDTHIKHLVCVLHLVKQLKAAHEDLGKRTRERLLRVLYRIMQDKLAESKVAPTVMMELLTALREAREDLVFRSVNEDPQLYSSFFQYEKNENLLSLSFEREYSIFINANLEKLSIRITDINDEVTQRKLKYITEEFVNFKQSRTTSCIDSLFLEDKVKQIEKIFSIFDKDKDRLEEINYIRRKDQVLFEREFNRLLGEQNGDI